MMPNSLASRLYRTWVLLHEQHEEPVTESRRSAQPQQNTKTPIIPVTSPQKKDEDDEEYRVKPKSPKTLEIVTSQPMKPAAQEMYHDSFSVDGKDYDLTIPMPAYQVMKDVLELSDTAAQTTNDVLHVAMLLFLDYADAATTMAESVGGGGSVESNWGRKKDDDDEEWARRCARKASWLCKPMCRTFKR